MAQNEGNGSYQPKTSLTGLARDLGHLPPAMRRVALEMSASLASVSLRVSREFVAAVPKAAAVLTADDVRNWAELGRRLAMGNVETAVKFFAAVPNRFAACPSKRVTRFSRSVVGS